ncbi:uncharacterized protein LOC111344946 [Stylophora pistillata]|uniref:uncharacterized protein LOC111344946 n=1 Tax=Stylophora pistillata TaxID=50429 RepID=UPI000C0518AE|nr:uncharacterized protein LOC111344946 [Stylophora pistillata]
MAPDSIAIEPEKGWEGATPNHSHVSLEWLTWTERSLGTRIQHVRQGGEFSIPHGSRVYTVDGYVAETRTVYEFHGCLFHGCHDCSPKRNQVAFASAGLNVEALRHKTAQKTATLQRLGYTVVEMWQCQWEKQNKSDPDLRTFIQSLTFTTPLQPREAFFGGRTGATTLYHRIDPTQGEQIRKLVPPLNSRSLSPVPASEKNRKKPMQERNHVCPHTDEERMLTGTWCTSKIHKAIEMGYQLKRIHQEWHFEKRQRGLFAPYVDTWLKIKQESSGYPAWCQTEEQKAHYVKQCKQKEGIDLNPTMITKNPGRKATAKLMLNSFWGKFGQNCNKSKVHQISHPAALLDLLDDPLQQVQEVRILSPELVEVVTKRDDQDPEKGRATNVFIAAFTTCQARLKLYESLEILRNRVLYYDTDSVVYK